MRRHDLAHLAPGAGGALAGPALDSAQQALFAEWLERDLPMVVTRQPAAGHPGDRLAPPPGVQLGLTLPQSGGRRRIACQFGAGAIRRVRPPLTIPECLPQLRPGCAAVLTQLSDRLAAAEIATGVYGSLSWESLSGWTYRHPESDIDLVCDLTRREQLAEALSVLAAAAARLDCRLDGELRFPGGYAAAWREVQACAGDTSNRVLVKSNGEVALRPLRALFEALEERRAHA